MREPKSLSYWIVWASILLFFAFVIVLFQRSAEAPPTPPESWYIPHVELEELEYGFPIPDPFEPPLFDRSYYDRFGDCVKC